MSLVVSWSGLTRVEGSRGHGRTREVGVIGRGSWRGAMRIEEGRSSKRSSKLGRVIKEAVEDWWRDILCQSRQDALG